MVSILKSASATRSKDQIRKQIASEIITVASHLRGTPEQRLAGAKKIVAGLLNTKHTDVDKLKVGTRNYVLRQAVGILDPSTNLTRTYPESSDSVTEKSHTPGPSSDLGNQPVEDKIPEPSDNESRSDYIQRLVNAGYSLAAATEAANQRYGPTPATVGGTTTVTKNWGFGGGKSKITTFTPKKGEIPLRSSSVSVPKWAIALDAAQPGDKITLDNGLRSASQLPSHYFPDAEYALRRHSDERAARHQENQQKIKSGKSEIPAWYVVSNAWNEK